MKKFSELIEEMSPERRQKIAGRFAELEKEAREYWEKHSNHASLEYCRECHERGRLNV